MDLNVADPQVRGALVTEPQDFQPATLSLYAPAGGTRRLFAVERGKDAPGVVRIFEQSPSGAFELVKTVKDAMLTSPVAVVAVGTDSSTWGTVQADQAPLRVCAGCFRNRTSCTTTA